MIQVLWQLVVMCERKISDRKKGMNSQKFVSQVTTNVFFFSYFRKQKLDQCKELEQCAPMAKRARTKFTRGYHQEVEANGVQHNEPSAACPLLLPDKVSIRAKNHFYTLACVKLASTRNCDPVPASAHCFRGLTSILHTSSTKKKSQIHFYKIKIRRTFSRRHPALTWYPRPQFLNFLP